MCGIYFSAGLSPSCTPSFFSLKGHILCGVKAAQVELSKEEISDVVEKFIKNQTIVKPEDDLKVANAKELREAINDLDKLRNGKLSVSGRAEGIKQLERRIDELKLTGNNGEPRNAIDTSSDKTSPSIDVASAAIINTLARGPDYASYTELTFNDKHIQMLSSVLSLRQPFTAQPKAANSLVLQFNGEIYNSETISSNDTNYILSSLEKNLTNSNLEDAIIKTFSALDGEYAFVLLDLSNHKVFFGKDFVGKRSLLCSLTESGLQLGSVLSIPSAKECKGNTISVVDLDSLTRRDLQVRSPQIKKQALSINAVEELYSRLKQACSIRQDTIVPLPTKTLESTSYVSSTVAVLFSGGLDCTVVAALLAENYILAGNTCVIDLLSVGFEHPRTGVTASDSPDRKLSEKSWLELSKRFDATCVRFRLVHVDVTYREWLAHKQRVFSLISPCATEMDLSIAIAFYFAARSNNCVAIEKKLGSSTSIADSLQLLHSLKATSENNNGISKSDTFTFIYEYTSAPRVLFSGLGADELYGGYSRHENLFNDLVEEETEASKSLTSAAYEALAASLAHDINVIYERNLGRDDRVMASWGKELRYPFLDEAVVEFSLKGLAPECKMKFWWETRTTKKGTKRVKQYERKHVLRDVARLIGLSEAASELKRAIQFGARSAKLELGQSKVKGTDHAT